MSYLMNKRFSVPYGLVLLGSLLLTSCASIEKSKPEPTPQPQIVTPVFQPAELEKLPPPPPPPAPPVKQAQVAIIQSSASESFSQVAIELKSKLTDHVQVFVLTGSVHQDAKTLEMIQASDREQVVAIGLRAARVARQLKEKQVIFCQVFNLNDGLMSETMKGVSSLPAPEQLFRDWKAMDPELQQVAVFTGSSMRDYILQARKAAARQGIALRHQIVKNDKAFLYATKHLPVSVKGHWLLPDNRVLSRKVLKEVLLFNSKEGRETVVFSPALLSFGGLFYVQVPATEIARLVEQRLTKAAGEVEVPGQDVIYNQSNEIGINLNMAKQLGLSIPATYEQFIYD